MLDLSRILLEKFKTEHNIPDRWQEVEKTAVALGAELLDIPQQVTAAQVNNKCILHYTGSIDALKMKHVFLMELELGSY